MFQSEKVQAARKQLIEIYNKFLQDPYFSYPLALKDDAIHFEEIAILGYPTELCMIKILSLREFAHLNGISVNCVVDVEDKIKNSFDWNGVRISTYDDFISQKSDFKKTLFIDISCTWTIYNKIISQVKKKYTVVRSEQFLMSPRYNQMEDHESVLVKSALPVAPLGSPYLPFYYVQNLEKILETENLFQDEKSLLVFYTTIMAFISNNYSYFGLYADNYFKDRYIASDVGFAFDENEVLADCGAYDGADSILFSDTMNKKFDYIHSFEADFRNFFNAQKNIEQYKKTTNINNMNVYPLAVWNSNIVLSAAGDGTSTTLAMQPDGASSANLHCIKLDGFLDKLTYLKLEVEGAENQALEGASGLIKKYKPKLAVSTYHLSDDFMTIPQTILNFDKNYKFYLRHHSLEAGTICFYCH